MARVVVVVVVEYVVDTGDLDVVATLLVAVGAIVVAEVVLATLPPFVAAAAIGQVFVVGEKIIFAAWPFVVVAAAAVVAAAVVVSAVVVNFVVAAAKSVVDVVAAVKQAFVGACL